MILTGRDGKPIIFNNTHIVAVTVCDEVQRDLQCRACIHCTGHSFFVKEPIEEVYLQIHSEPMPNKGTELHQILEKAEEPIPKTYNDLIQAKIRKMPKRR